RQTPTHAEDRGAAERARRHLRRMLLEFGREPRFRDEPRREVIRERRDDDGAAEHEEESHVLPQQEPANDLGLDHGGDREPQTEERARDDDRRQRRRLHASRATRCAVAIAVARKIATATIDGAWNDAMPQMPWPAVQPLERRAPNPARNPPTA